MLATTIAVIAAFLGAQAPDPALDDGLIVFDRPERTIEAIDAVYASMPPASFAPPRDRWRYLPRTVSALRAGRPLTIVSLGDSIVNDTCRSGWALLVQRRYPKVAVHAWVVVRGSTGCWWYKENERVRRHVLDKSPDLVIVGGISHRDDIDAVREVVGQIRAGSKADILLMTGPFGTTDPGDPKWEPLVDRKSPGYRCRLQALAAELRTGFVDLEGAWGVYVRDAGKDLDWWKRDAVHANERGEQILGRILDRWFDLARK